MIFDKEDFEAIAEFAFRPEYPGFTPTVIESPNGDKKWDEEKLYAHISPKYLIKCPNVYVVDMMWEYYKRCIEEATRICDSLEIPREFYPGIDSTLRILKYPIGATTAPHTDFDLFTISLYRNDKDSFKYLSSVNESFLENARKISEGIHLGEILSEVNGVKATEHEVVSSDKEQHSMVFFVIPDHTSVLPSGITVGDWIAERKARSRKTSYK